LAFTDCLQTAVQGFAHWTLLDPVGTWVNFWGLSRAFHFSVESDPTVPPPPDLSDGTPVYLYAVICSPDCPSGTPPCLLYADPRGIYKFLKMLRKFAGLFAFSPRCDLW
jgi:hypothetical protein